VSPRSSSTAANSSGEASARAWAIARATSASGTRMPRSRASRRRISCSTISWSISRLSRSRSSGSSAASETPVSLSAAANRSTGMGARSSVAMTVGGRSSPRAADGASVEAMAKRLALDANDHQARFDLALAHFSANKAGLAIDELLEIMRRNRAWNEDAARKQLIKIFEALGSGHELTLSGRRRLSSLLFS